MISVRQLLLGAARDRGRTFSIMCPMMSAPYRPAPLVGSSRLGTPKFVGDLAELERPRKHYVWYYIDTAEANDDMRNCPQGISDFPARIFPREERRLVGQ